MPKTSNSLLWKLAESDEVEIETRTSGKSASHRTTIWIVPTSDGVYIRSYKGKSGRWYQEALANPKVTIYVGRRKAQARAVPEASSRVTPGINAAYREKYGERWPGETDAILKRSLWPHTLRLEPEGAR